MATKHKRRSSFRSLKRSVGAVVGHLDLSCRYFDEEGLTQQLEHELAKTKKPQSLSLSSNRLKTVPCAALLLPQFAGLTKLSLDSNELTCLPDALSTLSSLRRLSAKGNLLVDFPRCLLPLARLEKLNLSDNSIASLPYEVADMAGLVSLRIAQNRILKLPTSLACLSHLKELVVTGNPLVLPPCHFARTTESILGYLELQHLLSASAAASTKFVLVLPVPFACSGVMEAGMSMIKSDPVTSPLINIPEINEIYTKRQRQIFYTANCGLVMEQGQRPYMEDRAEFAVLEPFPEFFPGLKVAFVGIYDGHGGSQTVEFLQRHLRRSIVSEWQHLLQKRLARVKDDGLPGPLNETYARFSPSPKRQAGLEDSDDEEREVATPKSSVPKRLANLFKHHRKAATEPEVQQAKRRMSISVSSANLSSETPLKKPSRRLSDSGLHELRISQELSKENGGRDSPPTPEAAGVQELQLAVSGEQEALAWMDNPTPHVAMSGMKEDVGPEALGCSEVVFDFVAEEERKAAMVKEDFVVTTLVDCIVAAFDRVDRRLMTKYEEGGECIDGSTAVVGCFVQNQLVVAHCGDTRAVLCRGGVAVDLTTDHKPNNPLEKKRIIEGGGTVKKVGPVWRVNGSLSTSRSLGDPRLKPHVSGVPDVSLVPLAPMDSFVIFATDGIWDVISSSEAVSICSDHLDVQIAASRLVAIALERNSPDNCSVVMFRLFWDVGGLRHVEQASA